MKLLINITFMLLVTGILISSEYQNEVYLFDEINYGDSVLNIFSCDSSYIMINNECYYELDLGIINHFIMNSPNINLILDINANGIIEPLEFCSQNWNNGRLIGLDCSPIVTNGIYNWLDISGEIPIEINYLTEIQYLKIPYNNLFGLVPLEICDLNLNFSNNDEFNLLSNDLCPPYPECIEDYMGTQSNWGTGSCEIGNCYDLTITQITALENGGDGLVNTYNDQMGVAHLLIEMHNDGPYCSSYPGIMITANYPGTSFPEIIDGASVNWWYAISANDTYFLNVNFDVSPYVPIGAEITLTAAAVTMGCYEEECIQDPYCHNCPSTDPLSLTIVIGEEYPAQYGDNNFDGNINILDIVLSVLIILNENYYYEGGYYGSFAMEYYVSDINQDNSLDILDIVLISDIIMSN